MKNFLSVLAIVLTLGFMGAPIDAEAAKRLGGGKSLGMKRDSQVNKTPDAKSSNAQSAPGAAAPNRSSWMGPLAGIAAGLGLAALASHFGFGDELASMMMIGLLVMAVVMVVGFIMRKRAGALAGAGASAGGSARGMHSAPAYKMAMPSNGGSMIGSGLSSARPAASRIPADFDVAAFSRNAKVNFIRLQAANDAGNLDDIRQFTTPEMFAELSLDIAERGNAAQKTEVANLEAEVVDVEEESNRYVVSVRFTGTARDAFTGELDSLDEVWHLVKPRQATGGWVLSGIEQV